ncbi:MAG: repair protein [Chitinophagaceae bacterium]|nr:repair protein [Chitinophagaceae bacterium]
MKQLNKNEIQSNVAEVELVYRTKVKASERRQVTDGNTAFRILLDVWNLDKIDLLEEFKILLLNRSNHVLGIAHLSSGGITGTVVDPRHIFALAIKANATSIILSHNHPSANLKPSQADLDITQKIKQAGTFLDIKVLDHLIMSCDGYYSFSDEGII